MTLPTYGAPQSSGPHLGNRIDALRHRLQKPGQQQGVKDQLQNLRARRYFRQQRHTPIPFSAAYDTTVGQARDTRDQTLASLAGKQQGIEQQYGINDTSNPYSEARQLESTYA